MTINNKENVEAEFQKYMESKGVPVGQVVADGNIHRFHVAGDADGTQNGAYILHADGVPNGRFGTWKDGGNGLGHKWSTKPEKEMTAEELKEYKRQQEEDKQRCEEEKKQRQNEAAKRSVEIWNAGDRDPNRVSQHPYLVDKGIKPHGARISTTEGHYKGWVMYPRWDVHGNIRNLQFISATGTKRPVTGGEVDGTFYDVRGNTDSLECDICEGIATALSICEATGHLVIATFGSGNMPKVAQAIKDQMNATPDNLTVKRFWICADNDPNGVGRRKAEEAAAILDCGVVLPLFTPEQIALFGAKTGGKVPTDFNDLHQIAGLEEVKRQIEEAMAQEGARKNSGKPIVLTGGEFLALNIPPKQYVVDPVMPFPGLIIIFADRGTGKTYLMIYIAFAIASGGTILRWNAPEARNVFYIDGEMPAIDMKARMEEADATGLYPGWEDNLRIFNLDQQASNNYYKPNLATEEGRNYFAEDIEWADVIIIDNINTMMRFKDSNNEDEWKPVQDWLIKLRASGKTVVLLHHTNKSGGSRGTSAREDVMDIVLKLERPVDYTEDQGARFNVRLTKARGVYGEQAEPFEAQLKDGRFEISEVQKLLSEKEQRAQEIWNMRASGMTQQDIARELGIAQSTVSKLGKKYPEYALEAEAIANV